MGKKERAEVVVAARSCVLVDLGQLLVGDLAARRRLAKQTDKRNQGRVERWPPFAPARDDFGQPVSGSVGVLPRQPASESHFPHLRLGVTANAACQVEGIFLVV